MDTKKILIIDDEQGVREELSELLKEGGYDVQGVGSVKEAKLTLGVLKPNLVLLDLNLPDGDGLDLVPEIRQVSEDTAIIVITGFGSLESAVESIQKEIFDYVTKPLDPEKIMQTIKNALEIQEAELQKKARLKDLETFQKVAVGREQKIIECKTEIEKLQVQIDQLKKKEL